MNKQKIVVIGGGSGTFMTLSGLQKYPIDISAIVTMSDNGGSTGVLRDELGVLPPGDVRQCLVALSQDSTILRELFNYRFCEGSFEGHSFGNVFLSAMEKITGSFDKAVVEASRILRIKGYVLPVTFQNTNLVAELQNGKKIIGEHNIENYNGGGRNIKKLYLNPKAELNPKIKKFLKEADKIVICPGDLYTSLLPNFLVKGFKDELSKIKAKIIYVVNLMTEPGQTDNFTASDYISELEKYMGKGTIKYAIYNSEMPDSHLLKKYAHAGEKPVKRSPTPLQHVTFIEKKLLSHKIPKLDKSDKIASERSLIRHDSDKLAKAIIEL